MLSNVHVLNHRGRDGISGADDGIRTRDPNLGKVVLYQLSHVRVQPTTIASPASDPKANEANQ